MLLLTVTEKREHLQPARSNPIRNPPIPQSPIVQEHSMDSFHARAREAPDRDQVRWRRTLRARERALPHKCIAKYYETTATLPAGCVVFLTK
jgi:hypothetical protein